MITPDCSTTRYLTTEKPGFFGASVGGLVTQMTTSHSEHKVAEGGLRLRGQFKISTGDRPVISVVTVVYNGAKLMEETIKSVIEQTYSNVEYIIVDGGSTDGTLEILKRYEDVIDYWVSEPDKGIYDAMNKGIDLAGGEWVNFMNAGDYFFDREVLVRLFSRPVELVGFDIIFGDHEVRYQNTKKSVKAGKIKSLWRGGRFCHQSSLVRLSKHKENKFDLSKKIAADYDFFSAMQKKGSEFLQKDLLISSVSAGGLSDLKRNQVYNEWRQSAREYSLNSKLKISLNYFFLVSSLGIKSAVKRLFSRK